MEAQPEWAAEEQPVAAQPSEWGTAEEQPLMEAQPEWAAEEQPAVAAQSEWAAEEQPVMEAQPEWASAEEQPVAAQSEWGAAEEQPTTPEWSASAEAQGGWAAPAEQSWMAPAEPAQASWDAPVEEARPEWNASAPAEENGWDAAVADEQAATEIPAEQVGGWDANAQTSTWGQDAYAAAPVEELTPSEAEMEPLVAAQPPPAPAEELPVMEAAPAEQEIDLSDDIVEEAPPPPAPVPVAVPIAIPAPRVSLAPAAVVTPKAPVAAAVFTAPATSPLVPGSPPPRASRLAVAAVTPTATAARVPVAPVNAFVAGEHRVIIHTVEGQVKRGAIRDVDLLDEAIPLEQQAGFAPERIAIQRVKAIFFMFATGARPPQPEGQKIRITFNDGRQVAGYSNDYQGTGQGFFVVPADTRTNTSRIFIYRSSVQAVAEG
jgi:hypothetical protein